MDSKFLVRPSENSQVNLKNDFTITKKADPMKLLSILMLMSFCLYSCSSDQEEQQKELKKEIMNIHDELMPSLDKVDSLKKALEENRNYLTGDSLGVTQGNVAVPVDSLIIALERADEGMMEWMRNYDKFEEETFSHEEQMEYLLKEKEKIEQVRLEMISSIMEAENVLEEKGVSP